MERISEFVKSRAADWLHDLGEFLAIPSVSAPFCYDDKNVARAADWLVNHFKKIGFNSELICGEYTPMVYAEWLSPANKFTLLIYCHYDVQPVEPLELWKSPPFEMAIRDGKIFARGVSDSKGHLFAYIKGIESILKIKGKLPVNVKFIIDGDEEAVELALPELLKNNPEKLEADAVFVGAGAMIDANTPSICYAVRGLLSVEIQVETLRTNLHSGSFGGGVFNAAEYLAKIIAGIRNEQGKITIPGFYGDVAPVAPEEKKILSSIFASEEEFLRICGSNKIFGEAGFSVHELITARPTFEVNGIRGGDIGGGFQFIVPAKASAKISFRLVPNQCPGTIYQQLEKYISQYANEAAKVTLKKVDSAEPAIMNRKSFVAKKAAEGLKEVFGAEVKWFREGGAVPVVYDFQKLGKNVIMVGFGLPDDAIHAPNEKLDLSNFYKEIEFSARFMEKLAEK
ncbi:MAG: dipeptidase [bacterium]